MRTFLLSAVSLLLLGAVLAAQSITFSGTLTNRQRVAVIKVVDAMNVNITAENAACAAAKVKNPADPCVAKAALTYAGYVDALVQAAIDTIPAQDESSELASVAAQIKAATPAKRAAAFAAALAALK